MSEPSGDLPDLPGDEPVVVKTLPAAEIRRILAGCTKCGGAVESVGIVTLEYGGTVLYVFSVCAACETDLDSRQAAAPP